MTTTEAHGLPVRELYYIERAIDEAALKRAQASLKREDVAADHPDREVVLTLSYIEDRDAVFSSTLVVRRMIPSGDQALLIYGSLNHDSGLHLRASYHAIRHNGDHYGTVEEVDD